MLARTQVHSTGFLRSALPFGRRGVVCRIVAVAAAFAVLHSALPARAETQATAPPESRDESEPFRHSVGTSLFVLANLFLDGDESPKFYQLNYKYMVTPKDGLSLEALTWKYHAPLGIPYGDAWEDPSNDYPGAVQAYGLGLAYQRFLWRGLYTAAHASGMRQIYLAENGHQIQTGFQLFMTFRLGYHVSFAADRVFIEPSIAITTWPINTNLPASFAQQEARWPRYFLGEPGFHLGVKF